MFPFAAANTPMKMVRIAARIMPITQPRTLRNLVHSARTSPPKPPQPGPASVLASGRGTEIA